MFHLMISYDCGINYESIQQEDSVEKLNAKAEEYNKAGLRWCIEDGAGEVQNIFSLIHKKIIAQLVLMNKQKEKQGTRDCSIKI